MRDFQVPMPPMSPPPRPPPPQNPNAAHNQGPIAIASYCGASILMTVTNKYVLSGYSFNLNFFLLIVQVWSIFSN